MLQFTEWLLQERAGREPARWKLLLWDMCATECPAHEEYLDADWPAWRLFRHARGLVGQYDEISQRAAQRGFGSQQNVHTQLCRFRKFFQDQLDKDPAWRQLSQCVENLQADVIRAGEAIRDRWDPFRQLLEPADDWAKNICGQLRTPLSQGSGLVLAVAHYPDSHAEFLPAVAFDVQTALAQAIRGLAVATMRLDQEDLKPQVQQFNPAPNSLLIVPVPGAAWFLDLEHGLRAAAASRCHLLVFCPDRTTAERIENTQMPGYCFIPIFLSPWYRPEAPEPGHPAVPPWAEDVAQRAQLLQALAAFSALHRRPSLALLAAITDLREHDIQSYITQQATYVQFDPDTRRAYWSSEDGSQTFLERFFDTPEKLRDLYVEIIATLDRKQPDGWNQAALNLLKSMYQTGRLRLLRAVLGELENRHLLPERVVQAFASTEQFQIRLDLARVYARAFLYKQAHELLLSANVPENDSNRFDDFWNHQLLCAEILTRQVADTGKRCFFEAAEFIYKDLPEKVQTDAGRSQQLDERRADLYLEAGKYQEALDLLTPYGSRLSLFGNAVKARALAGLGRLQEAQAVPTVSGRWRGVQLDKLDGETQDWYEERWSEHIKNLLGADAKQVPVEALHQTAQRALERGHFAEAQRLLEHARSHYRDEVYLAVAWARLLIETGSPERAVEFLLDLEKQLTGGEHQVVRGALYDALLEARRRTSAVPLKTEWQQRLARIPQPIFDNTFRRDHYRDHYLDPQYAYLITLNAKAYWREACGEVTPQRTAQVIAALARLNTPPALNLAARILADAGAYQDALGKLDAAERLAADPQTQIRTLNTRARVLLNVAAQGDTSKCAEADRTLQASEQLDAGNSYTMLLRAEWLELCGDKHRAAQLRQKAEALRRVSP